MLTSVNCEFFVTLHENIKHRIKFADGTSVETLVKRKKPRKTHVEETDRFGHWYREFSVRSEVWPIIEHWAVENGYRLAGMKGQKRLYSKGDRAWYYMSLFDVRISDGWVQVSAWIQVGWVPRLLSLFQVKSEITLDPHGVFVGTMLRRRRCHEMNSLLELLRQPVIHESQGLHLLDLNPGTLALIAITFFGTLGFCGFSISDIEIEKTLSPILLESIGKPAFVLLACGTLLVFLHAMVQHRLAERPLFNYAAVAVLGVSFLVGVTLAATRTGREAFEAKVGHYCLFHYDAAKCQQVVNALDSSKRDLLLRKIQLFHSEIARDR